MSLAYADLIVLFSAVPEALMFHHIGIRWVLGQAGCSLIVFNNFLGINAGSLRYHFLMTGWLDSRLIRMNMYYYISRVPVSGNNYN